MIIYTVTYLGLLIYEGTSKRLAVQDFQAFEGSKIMSTVKE